MPKVFETSKARSIKQIELRLAILKRWSNEGIPWRTDADGKVQRDEDGEAVIEYVPTSLPTFCSWTAKEHGAAALLLEFRSDSEERLSCDTRKARDGRCLRWSRTDAPMRP